MNFPNLTQIKENNRTSYWIVYFYQLIGGIFLAETLVILQNYQIYCITCATSQIEILGMRIKKIGYHTLMEGKVEDSVCERELLECLKYHKIVMR